MLYQFQSTRPRGRTRPETVDRRRSRRRFNPRVLAGGRDLSSADCIAKRIVSIHASSREDATAHRDAQAPANSFNPRVLAGGRDFFLCCLPLYISGFNPRVLAGGRDTSLITLIRHCLFQSTRPRGRTRPVAFGLTAAPLWFQSTRPRGRTRLHFAAEDTFYERFNPRVLAGGRDVHQGFAGNFKGVSIHASSREDATVTDSSFHTECGFNPRVLAGGRDRRV